MKNKRIINDELRAAVKQLACCACLKNGPSDVHHLKTVGSGGDDETWNLVSLCRRDHTLLHQIGLNKFMEKYRLFHDILVKKGWYKDEFTGKWKH